MRDPQDSNKIPTLLCRPVCSHSRCWVAIRTRRQRTVVQYEQYNVCNADVVLAAIIATGVLASALPAPVAVNGGEVGRADGSGIVVGKGLCPKVVGAGSAVVVAVTVMGCGGATASDTAAAPQYCRRHVIRNPKFQTLKARILNHGSLALLRQGFRSLEPQTTRGHPYTKMPKF